MKRLLITILIAVFLCGCGHVSEIKQSQLDRADFYATKGQEYIELAVDLYNRLIQQDRLPQTKDNLKLKLGNLYLETGRYAQAIDCFKGLSSQEAKKKLAIAYFKDSSCTNALAEFEKLGELKDNEYLYYYGQTLEKNNLYDKALEIYSLIPKNADNYAKVKDRIDAINLSEDSFLTQNITSIVEGAPSQEAYPQAGALILLADEEFEVFEDNTAQFNMHFMVKIFNERGKEEFSEVQIGYDSTFEEVELEYARTIKPDGTVVYVGDKNIRDVSVYLNYPLYSNARARIISMPEVVEGAIIEYKAKKFRKQLVNKKDFILNYSLQESEPIKVAKFLVKIPLDRSFNYKFINREYNNFLAELNPKESIEENKKIFSWHMEDIPEILPEPNMPPASKINPIIMMSSFNSWDEIYRWWYELYKDKIKIDKDIQNKINELVKGKESQEDKLRAIYNFCAQDIRYVAVEYGQAGYEPHLAIDIFKNKYGDCKDQSILLISMLRSIDIKAYPVLIATYEYLNLNEDFPSIAFNHCIVAVDFQGEWIFMDPTAQTVEFKDLPSSDQDRLVFLILDDGYKIIPTPIFEASHNNSKKKMYIRINRDETIYAKRSVDTQGAFQSHQRYWLRYTKPKLVEEALRSATNAVAPGAVLLSYKIENQEDLDKDIILEYEFQAPEFLAKAGNVRLLPQLGQIDIGSVVKEERNYPIEYIIFIESTNIIDIEMPDNFVIEYLPKEIKVDSPWFEFQNTYTIKDKAISFYEKYRLKKRYVSKEEYQEYKTLLEETSRQTNQNIILREKE